MILTVAKFGLDLISIYKKNYTLLQITHLLAYPVDSPVMPLQGSPTTMYFILVKFNNRRA